MDYLFTFLIVYFEAQMFLILSVFSFVAYAFDVKSKKPLPYPVSKIYSCFHLRAYIYSFNFYI